MRPNVALRNCILPTQKQLKASQVYADLMEEAKPRFDCIDAAVRGRTGLPGPAVQEFCFLQLRLLCELIAPSCLIAHEDITATHGNKLAKEYAADKIMKALEGLHPDFYPHPVLFRITPPGPGFPGHVHIDRKSSGFLSKPELLTLYGRCGDLLHRGTVKKLVSAKMPVRVNFPEIVNWTNKIVVLLDGHHIASMDGKLHFLCILRNANDKDRVQVTIAEAP